MSFIDDATKFTLEARGVKVLTNGVGSVIEAVSGAFGMLIEIFSFIRDLFKDQAAGEILLTATMAFYGYIFALITFVFLGYGFHLIYRKPKVDCAEGSYCARPSSGRTAKIGLWVATVLVIVALGFPKIAPYFL